MKKVGIITFHNSYNCGSMLESYAMQKIVEKCNKKAEIVNFSSKGQKELYGVWNKNNSLKNIIKNILVVPAIGKVKINNEKYENFKNENFNLSKEYSVMSEIKEDDYSIVIAGSDQIWNITIQDHDDSYFLPWVKNAKRVAYAPSFGAKKISDNTDNIDKYKKYLNNFDALSVRENNGQEWIKEMIGKEVPVLLDPTLLLDRKDYEEIENKDIEIEDKYIFFYSPSFDRNICKFVKRIADKYGLKVITWSTKSYYFKMVKSFGFELPEYEDPSVYLNLIKNAELVMTTSYHGTIFSTIYRKKFITIKNGGMYGNDDRVKTLLSQLGMEDRLIPFVFDESYNYLQDINYEKYDKQLPDLRERSLKYIKENIEDK